MAFSDAELQGHEEYLVRKIADRLHLVRGRMSRCQDPSTRRFSLVSCMKRALLNLAASFGARFRVSRAPKRPSASPRSRPLVISGIRLADCCTVIVPIRGDRDAEISPGGQWAGPLVYVTSSSMGRRFVLGMASMGRSGPEFPFGLDRAREVLAGHRSQGVMEPSTRGRLLHGYCRRGHPLHDVSGGAG